MARTERALVSFNQGEVSPLLDARLDMQQLGFGCRTAKNGIVEQQGGFVRRVGTRFIGSAKGTTVPGASTDALTVESAVSASGTRAPENWSITGTITLSPEASPGTDEFLKPVIDFTGVLSSGSQVFVVAQIQDKTGTNQWFLSPTWIAQPTLMAVRFGPTADEQPLTGGWVYTGLTPLSPTLSPLTFYRLALTGQTDPEPPSAYQPFTYGRWFTLNAGFYPPGFTPP